MLIGLVVVDFDCLSKYLVSLESYWLCFDLPEDKQKYKFGGVDKLVLANFSCVLIEFYPPFYWNKLTKYALNGIFAQVLKLFENLEIEKHQLFARKGSTSSQKY